MAVVSTRYAEALLSSALQPNDKEKFGEYLNDLSNLYIETELKQTIDNPRISKEDKLSVIKEIVPQNQVFINFIELLLKENRINLINDISFKYSEMIDKLNKVIKIEIISPYELSEKEVKEITSKYQKLYNANQTKYTIKIDETLIGGVKVICKTDNKIYDDTIKTKLNEIL